MFPTFYIQGGNVYFLTSNTYPAITPAEELTSNVVIESGKIKDSVIVFDRDDDRVTPNVSVDYINVNTILVTYYQEASDNVTPNVSIDEILVDSILVLASNQAYENISSNVAMVSGNLDEILVSFSDYAYENVTSNVMIVSGSLT